jgi:hypothetical protein
VLLVLGLLLAPASAGAKARPPVRGNAESGSQRTILKSNLKVMTVARRAGYARVFASFRTYGRKAPEQVISQLVEVRLKKGEHRRLTLRLNRIGRGIVKGCAGGRIIVHAAGITRRAGAPVGRASRVFIKLRRDAVSCKSSNGGGGGGGGSGGGGSGGGGNGGGANTNRDPVAFTPANPDRCDWIDEADCMLPFPNNHFTTADPTTDTKRRVNFDTLSMPRNAAQKPVDPMPFNRNDGFSPGQEILTKVPGLDTKAAFAQTKPVPIDDMGQAFRPSQPVVLIDAATHERQLIWTELDVNPPDPAKVAFIIRPGANLKEGHRYVVAMRNLKGADGKVLPANLAFRIYRDGIPTTDASVEARRKDFEGMFGTLAEAGIARDDLYRVWDFTVASERNLSERMLSIRDDAFAQLGDKNLADMKIQGQSPKWQIKKVENYTVAQNSNLMKKITGVVTVPCYLDAPGCPSGSRFAFDPTKTNGPPIAIPGNTTEAGFSCIVPRKAATAPARVSLYGHGLLGSKNEVGQGQLQNFAQEHDIIFCASDWIGMSCADLPDVPNSAGSFQSIVGVYFNQIANGTIPAPPNCDYPSVVSILEDMGNFPQLADRVQQGMLNFLYVGRAMIHPNGFNTDPEFKVGPGGSGAIDTSSGRLYYDGNSQGGIIGGALASIFVDGDRATLGVTGMNYSTLLQRSTDWGTGQTPKPEANLPEYSYFMYTAYPDFLQRQLLLSMIQMQWDRAEANGYALHMTTDHYPNTPPHEVILHGGIGDHQVAQITAETEARTIGASAHFPYAEPGRDLDQGNPIYGVPPITSYPFHGSAIVEWDIGPPRMINGKNSNGDIPFGTPPPPNENRPQSRNYQDPHEYPRKQPAARAQKSVFFSIGGLVIDPCPGVPCLADPTL